VQSESGERDGNQEMLISVPRNTFLYERFMKTVHLKQANRRAYESRWKAGVEQHQSGWFSLKKKQSVKGFLKMHSGLNWFSQDCKRQNLVLEQFQVISRTALYISATTAASFSTNQQRPTFGL